MFEPKTTLREPSVIICLNLLPDGAAMISVYTLTNVGGAFVTMMMTMLMMIMVVLHSFAEGGCTVETESKQKAKAKPLCRLPG